MIVDSSGARVTDHVARPSSSDRAAPRCGRPARDVWAEIFALDHGKLTNGAAAQRLSTNMLGSVFQYFAEITGEKVTAAQARAVARGVSPHRRSRSGMCAARAACWWSSPRPRRSWCGRSGLPTADHRHRRISHSRAGNDGGWHPSGLWDPHRIDIRFLVWASIHKEAARSDFSRLLRHPPVVRLAQLCRPSRSGSRRRAQLPQPREAVEGDRRHRCC